MKTLFIDTHLWNIDIALLNDGKLLKHEEVVDKKNNSEILFSSIVKVIDKEVPDEIIVVNGPGSFTGVRLGVIIAKTLAYTKNIPIKSITSLDCMAVSTNQKQVAFSDNNGYYVGTYKENYDPIEYKYVSNDEFNALKDYSLDTTYDYEKIWLHCQNKEYINPHYVNPIYIKKIGVEK